MSKIKRNCNHCGKIFEARSYQIKIGIGNFCSRSCAASSKAIHVSKRFWDKVDIKNEKDCWNWKFYKNTDGYGKVGISEGKTESSHRVAYKLSKGIIPKGKVVRHSCDNPACCNPSHLLIGSQSDNVNDMVSRSRLVIQKGENSNLSKLTLKEVKEIRESYSGSRGEKLLLSKKYNVRPTTITNILNRKSWA